MSTGIAIRHVQHVDHEDREVRSDLTAFLGVVTRSRWPRRARAGDFIELPLEDLDAFLAHPARPFFDAATRLAVRAFFANGGRSCTLFGVCIESSDDLMERERVRRVLRPTLARLTDDEDLSLLVMPPLAYLPLDRLDADTPAPGHHAVRLLLQHCRAMTSRFLILDAPRDMGGQGVTAWAEALRAEPDVDPSYGAIYHPWLRQGDRAVAPAGAVAGVYARADADNAPYGVRVAPANLPLRGGFTHLDVPLSWQDARSLVEVGVNPIMEQVGRGLVVWGARTLSKDPRWQHVASRRIVSFVTERVRRDAEWVVFEHQRPELWETVARMVRSRLDGFWNAGLLTGQSAGSEYLVQCDEELNPPAVQEAGQVHFRVMLRPISTTEFIEVELQLGA